MDAAKEFLKIDNTADDTLLEILIATATRKIESYLDKKLITQQWELFLDRIPNESKTKWWDGTIEGALVAMVPPVRVLEMPFGPLQGVDSFEVYNENGDPTTFSDSNYVVDNAGPLGRLALKSTAQWPDMSNARTINAIKITGTFGYGEDSEFLPQDIIHAVKMTVAHLYEHRGDEDFKGLPATVLMLLEPHRMIKGAVR